MYVANSSGTRRVNLVQVSVGRFATQLDILEFGSFSSCPGDGGEMAENVTTDGHVAVQLTDVLLVTPSPARTGKWIGE